MEPRSSVGRPSSIGLPFSVEEGLGGGADSSRIDRLLQVSYSNRLDV
jgi:hypothetical protein